MSRMIPTLQNPCQYGPTEFRVVPTPVLPLPPNHVLLYCLCPCGAHRTHFTIHRNVLLTQIGRNQSITQHVRAQPHLQRLAEIQLQARFRRYISRKEHRHPAPLDLDQEEDIDR
ncbi:hypothetical protein WN55_02613 [Dufourea novaeangliae]|uniref:Uncharacterized protein n=1 Tax=Dufourea novaeangliae TaxID=178035 RepID=A0A154PH68_DUFNO|nr:hypothetical protein WN55_02613 [Dufourea novaeangliae]